MDLRYPIGKFDWQATIGAAELSQAVAEIAAAPANLRAAVAGLSDAQLDTPYRPEGWTVRQVVHHLADSHINSYTRVRRAVTENEPAASEYDEKLWAELADASRAPVELSLVLLGALHQRWVLLLQSFGSAEWARTFVHPKRGAMRLDTTTALYAWHCRHHVAHITALRQRNGW
jgi:hypothetical protein